MKKISGFLDYRNKNSYSKERYLIHRVREGIVGFDKEGDIFRFGYLYILFSGEIYNSEFFKEKLSLYGYSFNGGSDGEVALKAIHKWGEDIVSKFDGDFQIAVLNTLEERLCIFRDKIGIMPFYYLTGDDFIFFSNEIKDILNFKDFQKEISKEALALYMSFSYILEPFSIWKNVYKIQAGNYLDFDLKKKTFEQKRYFDVAYIYNLPYVELSQKDIIDNAEKLLVKSIEKRTKNSKSTAVLLSGGYDSSTLAALFGKYSKKPLYTITIGFEEKKYDESVYARYISKAVGSFHHEFIFTPKSMRDSIPFFVKAYEEPFGDKAAFGTIYGLDIVKNEIDTVCGGDGGDEVFGTGDDIEKFRLFKRIPSSLRSTFAKTFDLFSPDEIINKKSFKNIFTKIEKAQNILKSENISQMLKHKSQTLSFKEVKEIVINCCDSLPTTNFDQKMLEISNDELNNLLAVTIKTYLIDDEIVKSQRAASYFGLDLKEPYLDEALLDFMGRIPQIMKQKDGIKKYILKQIAYRYIPKEFLEREKHGFSFPLERWFRGELKDLFLDYISKERIEREGFFDAKKTILLRDDFFNGSDEKIVALWSIFIFELWYEEWMK